MELDGALRKSRAFMQSAGGKLRTVPDKPYLVGENADSRPFLQYLSDVLAVPGAFGARASFALSIALDGLQSLSFPLDRSRLLSITSRSASPTSLSFCEFRLFLDRSPSLLIDLDRSRSPSITLDHSRLAPT